MRTFRAGTPEMEIFNQKLRVDTLCLPKQVTLKNPSVSFFLLGSMEHEFLPETPTSEQLLFLLLSRSDCSPPEAVAEQ